MITKTEALVLRVSPFSKTSHIVTWLTQDHGKISTVIKGACRPKSAFLGQYDLFYTCELLYYTRERNGLHIAKECSPLDMRLAFRNDWRASAAASYICDLISRISMRGGHEPELYDLAEFFLNHICMHGVKPQLLFWFELKLVRILGLDPQLTNCASCEADISVSTKSNRYRNLIFSPSQGGILCPNCATPNHNANAGNIINGNVTISPDIIAMFRNWQAADNPRSIQNIKCSDKQLLAFRNILGIFLNFHLELILQSRKLALSMAAA